MRQPSAEQKRRRRRRQARMKEREMQREKLLESDQLWRRVQRLLGVVWQLEWLLQP